MSKIPKTPAVNERSHASGGVCPQTVLWEFGSLSPAQTFVEVQDMQKQINYFLEESSDETDDKD